MATIKEKMRGFCWLAAGVVLTSCALHRQKFPDKTVPLPDRAQTGVLILAHGGSGAWNSAVRQTVESAQLNMPVQIAFGMGMHGNEVENLQHAVDSLNRAGVNEIVAVPLLVSSYSEVMRQYEYLLGASAHGPWEDHAKPVHSRAAIRIARPLDDDPAVSEVLLDRAREISRAPEQETIVLVAHGPNEDDDNVRWLQAMQRVADRVRQTGRFHAVVPVTMRDDAPDPVLAAATAAMRERVQDAGAAGRVLVVPLLIASGGVDHKIPQRLEGLDYVFQSKALLPHPAISRWIARHVAQATGSAASVDGEAKLDPATIATP